MGGSGGGGCCEDAAGTAGLLGTEYAACFVLQEHPVGLGLRHPKVGGRGRRGDHGWPVLRGIGQVGIHRGLYLWIRCFRAA